VIREVSRNRATPSSLDLPRLHRHLDALRTTYDRDFLETDPLAFVHRYAQDEDREVVGFLAAGLAFGGVDQIRASVSRLLETLGPRPAATLRSTTLRDLRSRTRGLGHRFLDGEDLARTLRLLGRITRRSGSLRAFFLEGAHPGRDGMRAAIASFSARALALWGGPRDGRPCGQGRGVRFFFASPADGSACKRLNLFLRWMVREEDGLDLGIWRDVSPRDLILPLDTHVSRIARYLGLTHRRTIGWAMAEEVTAVLRRLDPDDPVRYDFAIARLGILDRCPRRRRPDLCAACPIEPVCRL